MSITIEEWLDRIWLECARQAVERFQKESLRSVEQFKPEHFNGFLNRGVNDKENFVEKTPMTVENMEKAFSLCAEIKDLKQGITIHEKVLTDLVETENGVMGRLGRIEAISSSYSVPIPDTVENRKLVINFITNYINELKSTLAEKEKEFEQL